MPLAICFRTDNCRYKERKGCPYTKEHDIELDLKFMGIPFAYGSCPHKFRRTNEVVIIYVRIMEPFFIPMLREYYRGNHASRNKEVHTKKEG